MIITGLRKDPTILTQIENDFNRMIPLDLKIPGGRNSPIAYEIADRIRQFYLKGKPVSLDSANDMVLVR